jgi:hypothetical protein
MGVFGCATLTLVKRKEESESAGGFATSRGEREKRRNLLLLFVKDFGIDLLLL